MVAETSPSQTQSNHREFGPRKVRYCAKNPEVWGVLDGDYGQGANCFLVGSATRRSAMQTQGAPSP
jgi:hypothetical protein